MNRAVRNHHGHRRLDLANADPAPLSARSPCGFNDLVDKHAIAKGWPDRLPRRDCLEEVTRLDNDLILIARAMTRAEAERSVVWVGRTNEYFREAATIGASLSLEKPKRVLILLVEANSAFRAEYLVRVAHLPASRNATRKQRAKHAARETANDLRLIVVGDLFRSGIAGPLLMYGLDLGD